jgi:hypothetical protein
MSPKFTAEEPPVGVRSCDAETLDAAPVALTDTELPSPETAPVTLTEPGTAAPVSPLYTAAELVVVWRMTPPAPMFVVWFEWLLTADTDETEPVADTEAEASGVPAAPTLPLTVTDPLLITVPPALFWVVWVMPMGEARVVVDAVAESTNTADTDDAAPAVETEADAPAPVIPDLAVEFETVTVPFPVTVLELVESWVIFVPM